MEEALQKYERVTKEVLSELRVACEAERAAISRERRDLEEDRRSLTGERRDLEEDRRYLTEDRRALQADRQAVEADRHSVAEDRAALAPPADRVLLDVGGRHFTTTRRTLTAAREAAPASYLVARFGGAHAEPRAGDGRAFIDRNGSMFEYVLDFLRGYAQGDAQAAFAIHTLSETQRAAMRQELDYYGLGCVVFPNHVPRRPSWKSSHVPKRPSIRRPSLTTVLKKSSSKRSVFRAESDISLMSTSSVISSLSMYENAVVPAFSIDLATFSDGPEMALERDGLGAVVLPENQGVLFIGGRTDGGTYQASTEKYDAHSDTFSPGPTLASRRWLCAAAVLEDGTVVVVGGHGLPSLSTTEVLDPHRNTWSPGPDMATGRCGCAVLPLSNSRLLVIGGARDFFEAASGLSTTEVIDLARGTSTAGPAMSCARTNCSAVMLEDGRVLVIGGNNGTTRSLSTTEILDLARGCSSLGPVMETARFGASAIFLPEDGRVLVIGGRGTNGTFLSTTEVLDVTENTASEGPELSMPRYFSAAVPLPERRILVIGGCSGSDQNHEASSEILGMPPEEV